MKKLVSILMIICMLCAIVPSFAEEITGDWYLNSVSMGEAVFNPADMGMSLVLHFDEDGHVTQTAESMGTKDESSGVWLLDGQSLIINMNNEAQDGVFEDGKITIESEGQTGVFTRVAPVATEKPSVVAAGKEEEFFGEWTLSAMDMMGVYAEKDQFEKMGLFGYEANLIISDGKIDSTIKMGEGEPEQDAVSDYIFDEGKLFVNIDLSEEPDEGTEEAVDADTAPVDMNISATIEKVDDGSILYSVDFLGMSIGMYLTRVDPAE